jgi:hypothetical protein
MSPLDVLTAMNECPMCSVETATATQTRDMSTGHKDAWVWGVVLGWDAASIKSMNHRWDEAAKNRLRRLHAAWVKTHVSVCVAAKIAAAVKRAPVTP